MKYGLDDTPQNTEITKIGLQKKFHFVDTGMWLLYRWQQLVVGVMTPQSLIGIYLMPTVPWPRSTWQTAGEYTEFIVWGRWLHWIYSVRQMITVNLYIVRQYIILYLCSEADYTEFIVLGRWLHWVYIVWGSL